MPQGHNSHYYMIIAPQGDSKILPFPRPAWKCSAPADHTMCIKKVSLEREREGRRGGLVNIMNMRSIPPPPGTTTTLYQS